VRRIDVAHDELGDVEALLSHPAHFVVLSWESALARHEAARHVVAAARTALTRYPRPAKIRPILPPSSLQCSTKPPSSSGPAGLTGARVAGLIRMPAEPIADDMQPALTELRRLTEPAVRGSRA